MVGAISNANQSQPVAQSTAISSSRSTQSNSQPVAAGSSQDTVQLSSAAQAHLAAIREAEETPSQTAKEASGGDRQAQRLLAREAAARISAK